MVSSIGTAAIDLHEANQELKRKNDDREKSLSTLLNSDVIQL